MITAEQIREQCSALCDGLEKEFKSKATELHKAIEIRMLNSIQKDPTKRYVKISSGISGERFINIDEPNIRALVKEKMEGLGYSWGEVGIRGFNSKFEVTIGW